MPFDSLSPDDRRYVRKLLTAKGDAAQLPPPTPTELGELQDGRIAPVPLGGGFGASPLDSDSRLRDEGAAAEQTSLQEQPDGFAFRTNHLGHSNDSRAGATDKLQESHPNDQPTSAVPEKPASGAAMLRQRPPL